MNEKKGFFKVLADKWTFILEVSPICFNVFKKVEQKNREVLLHISYVILFQIFGYPFEVFKISFGKFHHVRSIYIFQMEESS